jgi:predicted KAP-like P-loop ATPase
MKDFFTDNPIKHPKDDKLNRGSFAQSIANALCNEKIKDGYTVGLYGSWGCGKTSLLNIIEYYIAQKQNVRFIHFNPWLCDNAKQMAVQFYGLLLSEIKKEKKFTRRFKKLASLFFECVGFDYIVTLDLKPFAKMLNVKNNSLDKQKEKLDKMLKNQPKIVVIIDEIDRLKSEEILELFRMVKSVDIFPNVVFLLAFDREKVVQLLNSVNNSTDGDNYLEKIIQYPIEVPQPNESSVWNYFIEELYVCIGKELDINENLDLKNILDNGLYNLVTNIRNAKRYLNTFLFNYTSIGTETYMPDLIGITTIQVFAPDIYKRIIEFKDEIFPDPFYRSFNEEKRDEILKKLLNDIIGTDVQGNISKKTNIFLIVIKALFPNIVSLSFVPKSAYSTHRICEKDYFDRYFTMQISKSSVTNADLKIILNSTDIEKIKYCLKDISERGSLNQLTMSINNYYSYNYRFLFTQEQILCLYESLLYFWCENRNKYADFYTISFTLYVLLCRMAHNIGVEKATLTAEKLTLTESPEFLELIQYKNSIFYDIPTGKTIFSEDENKELEKIFTSRVVVSLENDNLWDDFKLKESTYLGRLIFVLEDINAALQLKVIDYVKDKIEKSDSRLLLWTHQYFVTRMYESGRDNSIFIIENESNSKIVSLQESYNRLYEYSKTQEFKEEPEYLRLSFCAIKLYFESEKKKDRFSEQEVLKALSELN